MKTKVDLTHSRFIEIPSLSEGEATELKQHAKGWSFSFVFNFSEIRDVFIALNQFSIGGFELSKFFKYCQSIKLPFTRTPWNERRLLEHLNALKNFGLIGPKHEILENPFSTRIGEELNPKDIEVFRRIYFTYFRFKEMMSWFINPISENKVDFIESISDSVFEKKSNPLFVFSNKSRFTDSYIYDLVDNTTVYYIDLKSEDLMRFWDVFMRWGQTLGVIEKFNLKNLDIKTIENKSIACVYALNNNFEGLDLLNYLNQYHKSSYIYLPHLVLELVMKFRLKVETIHKLIIDQYKVHKEYLSFERTSEIFVKQQEIKNGDKIFFPKYNDSYISHIIVRK